MKKTIQERELYQAPLCREYILATQIGMLQTSPNQENPGTNVDDFNQKGM